MFSAVDKRPMGSSGVRKKGRIGWRLAPKPMGYLAGREVDDRYELSVVEEIRGSYFVDVEFPIVKYDDLTKFRVELFMDSKICGIGGVGKISLTIII